MYKPLEGVKVVDFTLAGSGPSCTKLLTEFGAETVWVEPLWGTSTRLVHKFDFYTTGKRDITLNLKTEEGMEAMIRLIRNADVFVTNYRPQALHKLGLDYESVKKLNETIVYASLTGFGEEGEEANNPGYDPVAFWAKGGLLQDIAEKGSLVVAPISIGDCITGMALAWGIAAGLFGRERTKKGCHMFTSLFGNAVYFNHDAMVEVQYGEKYPKSRRAPRKALLNTYQCSDGKWIMLSIAQDFDRYWKDFCTKVIDRPELADDPNYTCMEDTMYEKAPAFVEILDQAFGSMTQEEALRRLRAIDAPVDKVQSTEEMMQDPQALANKYVYKLEASLPPEGKADKQIWIPAAPVKVNELDSGIEGRTRGPKLGEHSAEILKEIGYTDDEIRSMIEKKVTSQCEK